MAAARADLDAAIEAGIPDARAWWARSTLNWIDGDSEAARADLEAAIERDPLNAGYRYELGMSLIGGPISLGGMTIESEGEDAKDFDEVPEAQPHLGLAMELAPDNPVYRRTYETYMGF